MNDETDEIEECEHEALLEDFAARFPSGTVATGTCPECGALVRLYR